MKWIEKNKFSIGKKCDFEPIDNSDHATQYLELGKNLPARLYLKVKVYMTYLLSAYNLQKISCLTWNNFSWIFIYSSIPLALKTYLP